MAIKALATRLACLLMTFLLISCGKSPWSDYSIERGGNLNEKVTGFCPLFQAEEFQWVRGPFNGAESEFQINFLEKPTADLNIELWMPSMGHGSAPVKIFADPSSETLIHVRNVYFIMGGDWDIRIKNAGTVLCIMKVQIQ